MQAFRRRAALIGIVLCAACGDGAGTGPTRRIVVPQGATFRATTDSLAQAGVVRFPSLFRLYAKFKGSDRSLKPGTYVIRQNASWSAILAALSQGKGLLPTITIPEGFSLSFVVPQLARVLSIPEDSVDAAVRDTALLHRLDIPSGTLEGYLFPATYSFPPGTSARVAIAEMVRMFESRWKPEWNVRLDSLKLSRHDALTLASIVEKEAKLPEERPVIAAVYLNRLRTGMLLQADPTVQYAKGKHTARVLYRDLEVDSPYNTYRHAGLPPGPIGNPGAPSIAAALNPANVPYLYFVAYRDGHHEFRRTFAEHQEAIRVLRRTGDSLRADSISRIADSVPRPVAPPAAAGQPPRPTSAPASTQKRGTPVRR